MVLKAILGRRGAGDRNRGFHEPKQTVEKVFQDPEENLRQPNYPDVPFNINERGERGGNHY